MIVYVERLHTASTNQARCRAGVEADLIIYVTNYDQCQGDNIASSRFCASDTLTNRPVAGGLDFCNFGRHQFRDDLMVTVHEMIHILVCTPNHSYNLLAALSTLVHVVILQCLWALCNSWYLNVLSQQLYWTRCLVVQGMSSRFFNVTGSPDVDTRFINSDLSPKKLGQVVETYTSAVGRQRFRVITPSVKAAAARHFRCPSLRGGTLEDDLGEGSVTSHWDRRLFQGEIMDPVAGENTAVGRHVITNVTLALLQDTGW